MPNTSRVQLLAQKLNLWNVAKGKVDLNNEVMSNIDYLEFVFSEELNLRHQSKIQRLIKESHLPQKTFDYSKLGDGLIWHIDKLKQLSFIEHSTNIIIIGKCFTGKTSLGAEIGNQAVNNEYGTYYCTFDEFVDDYICKNKKWSYIKSCDLLIIDDVFYIDADASCLMSFYKAITFLNETTAIIIITNRKLSDWDNINSDTRLCQTVKDRILSNSEEIRLK